MTFGESKPALLLDVDGVICPFPLGAHGDLPEGYEQFFLSDRNPRAGGGDWVAFSPANKDRLARLAQTFELIWATGWEEKANEMLCEPHGLDPLPVIAFFGQVPGIQQRLSGVIIMDDDYKQAHWKMPWIANWAAITERALVWVDDEVGEADVAWAEARTAAGIPTLVKQVPQCVGMNDKLVSDLEDWWKGVSQIRDG